MLIVQGSGVAQGVQGCRHRHAPVRVRIHRDAPQVAHPDIQGGVLAEHPQGIFAIAPVDEDEAIWDANLGGECVQHIAEGLCPVVDDDRRDPVWRTEGARHR